MNDQPNPTPRDRLRTGDQCRVALPHYFAIGTYCGPSHVAGCVRVQIRTSSKPEADIVERHIAERYVSLIEQQDRRDAMHRAREAGPDFDIEEQWENTPTILARIGWLLMILGCLMLWSLIWIVLP